MLAEQKHNIDINDYGEVYFFKSNKPLLLDNPEAIWLVNFGALTVNASQTVEVVGICII